MFGSRKSEKPNPKPKPKRAPAAGGGGGGGGEVKESKEKPPKKRKEEEEEEEKAEQEPLAWQPDYGDPNDTSSGGAPAIGKETTAEQRRQLEKKKERERKLGEHEDGKSSSSSSSNDGGRVRVFPKLPAASSAPRGTGYGAFSHKDFAEKHGPISAIEVRSGDWVDGICVCYGTTWAPSVGGNGGNPTLFAIPVGEWLSDYVVCANGSHVQSIQLITNKGFKSHWMGGGHGNTKRSDPKRPALVVLPTLPATTSSSSSGGDVPAAPPMLGPIYTERRRPRIGYITGDDGQYLDRLDFIDAPHPSTELDENGEVQQDDTDLEDEAAAALRASRLPTSTISPAVAKLNDLPEFRSFPPGLTGLIVSFLPVLVPQYVYAGGAAAATGRCTFHEMPSESAARYGPITAIEVCCGGWIDAIRVRYGRHWTAKFGGGGGDRHLFSIPRGHLLRSFEVAIGRDWVHQLKLAHAAFDAPEIDAETAAAAAAAKKKKKTKTKQKPTAETVAAQAADPREWSRTYGESGGDEHKPADSGRPITRVSVAYAQYVAGITFHYD